MPESDVTIGELARSLAKMEERMSAQIKDVKVEVNRRLDTMQYVSQETHSIQVQVIERRLDAIEERDKWRNRALVTVAMIPFFVTFLDKIIGGGA